MKRKIGFVIGSLRKDSFNRKIAKELMKLAPDNFECEFIEIDQLPLYNQDEDANPPAAWVSFRNQVKQCDGIIFATPEYNRSMPGVLKNAIDVGSRPYGSSVWDGKAGAVISASPGAIGGFGANHHLRQCFVFLNVHCMQTPEAYIAGVDKLFDADGNMNNQGTREYLAKFMASYVRWVDAVSTLKQ